ncbi:hypothetical protein FLONG3_1417 [Fusarium longipes]|uniref:DUF6590 domain-containing protein n=1 Tax=Fusarium longipes TaxID=694270 RepID=A0A395T7T7_9HYPO|nr:hypothetical protein FLONG3_1417 [Fusarium longipes]
MYQTSRSGWSEWSSWIWNPEYQQYYRHRVDSSGAQDIQWQSEYEAAQNNQTPRTPVEQMTQQFGAVNIRSPEQTVGDEQNRKAPVQENISEDDEQDYDDRYAQRKAPNTQDEIYYDETTRQYYQQPAQVTTPTQQSGDAAEQWEDPEILAAIAESKRYTRDRYGSGESSSATYAAYTQDEEEEPTPAVPSGNQEHIIGTTGETETLDPRLRLLMSFNLERQAHTAVNSATLLTSLQVFKVLWPEPAGGGSIVEETVYRDQYGGRIFVHFRRFIVVANDLGHCTCIPISTYGKKGCKKSGVKAEQHGIVTESGNRTPAPLRDEPKLGYPPVRVHIYESNERISKESRVNYSKLTTVEHNVKVLFIGRVVSSDWDIVTEAVNNSWANKMHTHKRKHRAASQSGMLLRNSSQKLCNSETAAA